MTEKLRVRVGPEAIFLISCSLLCTVVLCVSSAPGFWLKPSVSTLAVTIDLALGFPVLGYFFLVRTGKANWMVLILLAGLGMLLAKWWVPGSDLRLSGVLEIAVVMIEAALLIALVLRIRKIRRVYRAEKARQPYRVDAFRVALTTTLGRRVGAAIFNEVSILWYAFAGWTRRRSVTPKGVPFSGHRRNAYPALLAAFMMAVVVETAVVHLLVSLWIGWLAWLLTGLGVYSLAWLLGDFQAARLNPSLLTESHLYLRTGLRWQADLALEEIIAVHSQSPSEKYVKMVMFGSSDLWLECSEPILVRGIFGIERRVKFVGLGLDDPDGFRKEVQSRIVSPRSAWVTGECLSVDGGQHRSMR